CVRKSATERRSNAREQMLKTNSMKFFFFSSRRRHTRWPRDWSSDVCSSDLLFGNTLDPRMREELHYRRREQSADVRLAALNVNADGTGQHQRKLHIFLQNPAGVLCIADFNELQWLP